MSGDLYRDAHLGMRARLAELDARIEEREAEVTDAFWDTLAPALREQLVMLRQGRELAASESLEELARGEGMLTAYLDELDRLIATLPSMEAAWMEVPDDVDAPPAPRSTWGDHVSLHEAEEVLRGFTSMVRDRSRDAVIDGERPSYLARFRDHGAPFALRATLHRNGSSSPSEVSMFLVTSIPRALPRLLVRHESLVLSVGKLLGIKHEVEIGEASFDGLFLIEGAKEAAELFLVPAMRGQLMALSRYDVPTLDIDPKARTASVQWRFEPAAKALDAAIRILSWIRATPPSVRFRAPV